MKVGVGVKVGVAVGVRVIFTTSTCETAIGSLDENAREIVGVPYQAKIAEAIANTISTKGIIELAKTGLVLVRAEAAGCLTTTLWRSGCTGGLARIRWIAQCIP